MSDRDLSPPRNITNKDMFSSLRVPHSPPPKGDAPGVGASGIRSRSGGMSFTVNSNVSTRCFHASGNENDSVEEQINDRHQHKSNPLSSLAKSFRNDHSEKVDNNSQNNNCLEEEEQPSREKLWSYLFHNVNRAVDELYYLCEAEDSLVYSEEARSLLLNCSRDFDKLIERSEAQRQYEASLKDHEVNEVEGGEKSSTIPSGIAWEVRKTANATPPICRSLSGNGSIDNGTGQNGTEDRGEMKKKPSMGEHVIRHALETMEEKARLERASSTSAPKSTQEAVQTAQSLSPPLPPKLERDKEHESDELLVFATSRNSSLEPDSDDDDESMSAPVAPKARRADFQVHQPITPINTTIDATAPVSARERRNRRRQEASVAASSPRVFAGVESSGPSSSLLSAALAAKRIPSPVPPPQKPVSPPTSMPKASKNENNTTNVDDDEILETEKVWAVAQAWVEAEAAAEELAWERLQRGDVSLTTLEADDKAREANSLARGSPAQWLLGASDGKTTPSAQLHLEEVGDLSHQARIELEQGEDELMGFGTEEGINVPPPPPTAVDTPTTPPSNSEGGFGSSSARGSLKRSGSGSEVDALLIRRAMHTKLSSPTRMKPSAEVTNAKAEMRHDKAQKNRELLETNRKMRVGEAAERAKLVKGRVESQQSAIEESHFSKLSAGEERHAQHIAAIRVKAENENIKVEEVLFINGLTAAGIKRSLDDRLREIEERMELGRLRKAEEMEAKKEQQRRKEKMVLLKLRNNEQLAGERWLKLQALIEDVGRRRKERLDEIARRRNATTTSASSMPPPAGAVTTLDASIEPFAASESLPTTPLPTPPRPMISKSFSFPDENRQVSSPPAPPTDIHLLVHHDDLRKTVSLDERHSTAMSTAPTPPSKSPKHRDNELKTNSRAQQLLKLSPSRKPNRSSSYQESSSSSPVPLALPGSLAAASFQESNTLRCGGKSRDSKKRFDDREGSTRSAGLDDGASGIAPNAEPIVNPKNKSPSPVNITSSTPAASSPAIPNPTGKPLKRRGSGAPDNPGSFNEKWSSRGGKKSGMRNTQSFEEKGKNNSRNDEDEEGGGGIANRGKKLRKLRTKLLRLAPGWSESRWGSAQSDSWNTPVGTQDGLGAASIVNEPALNDTSRMRLDRCVETLRKFRDAAAGGGVKNKGNKSPVLTSVTSQIASTSEIETSLHDLGRLLSDLSMGVGASTSAQSAAVQRRIRESGGLELLQQLTAPRHGVFNSSAAPLALDALSHCFACQTTQRDFVLAVDAGVGVVDAASYALELVMTTENSLVSHLTRAAEPPSTGLSFGTTTGSNRSLASLSAMVERASQPSAQSRPLSKADPVLSSSVASSVNPWEMLNTTILLLMHLLRHSAASGLEVAQESMVRFLCVTGFLQDLVSLLIGSGNWASIASIAIGETSQSSLSSDRRYQLLTNVEARTLLRRSLSLLEAVAAFPLVLTNDHGGEEMKMKNGSLVSPGMLMCQSMTNVSTINVDTGRAASGVRRLFEETNAGGIVSILSEIMLYSVVSPGPLKDHLVRISDDSLELCAYAISCLNNIARLELELFQKLLLPNKVLSLCHSILTSVNSSSGLSSSRMSRTSKYLLSEMIIFIGFFVLNKAPHQDLLLEDLNSKNPSRHVQKQVSSRRKKTIDDMEDEELNSEDDSSKGHGNLLNLLLLLPRDRLSDQNDLLPTFLAASHKNEKVQQFLGEPFMAELRKFIEVNAEAMHLNTTNENKKKNDKKSGASKLKIEVVSQDATITYPFWVALSHRFPIEFWIGKEGFVANSAVDRCTEAV